MLLEGDVKVVKVMVMFLESHVEVMEVMGMFSIVLQRVLAKAFL